MIYFDKNKLQSSDKATPTLNDRDMMGVFKTPNTQYRILKDKAFFILVIVMSFIVAIPLIFMLYHIVKMGAGVISWEFLSRTPRPMGQIGGGIINGIIGTFILILLASIMAIPIGIGVGVYLSEFRHHKLAKYVRFCAEVLQGVPSIVLGIVAYLWIVLPLRQFSALAGALALAIMMLPIIIRSTEETLKMVPETLKEASLSLGVPYSTTIIKVVLPCALNGIVTSILIGVARIAGETAPLLFTAFGDSTGRVLWNILRPIQSLPRMIYDGANSPYPSDHQIAWGISLVLCAFVLGLNLIAKGVSRKWKVRF